MRRPTGSTDRRNYAETRTNYIRQMSEIPLVDLAPWFSGDHHARARVANEVDSHLQRLGFLVVVNHGIAADLIERCRAEALAFFHLSIEEKSGCAMDLGEDDAYRGWVSAGLESTAATYGLDMLPDLRESFTCGPVVVPDPALRQRAPRWFAPNVWPPGRPAFQQRAEEWWIAARDLADELLDIFSLALDLPRTYLRDKCTATTADATFNYYMPRSDLAPAPGQFRIGPHTDFGTLTILNRQPGAGCLQVLNETGTWIDAPDVPDSLVINTGDLMRQWTNDRWESNQHRVLPPPETHPDEELLSLVFFHEPNFDTQISVLDTCVSAGRPPRYAPISAADYLATKMDALAVDTTP